MNFKEESFNNAVNILPPELKKLLLELNSEVKSDTYEIRLRAGKPIILFGRYGCLFLKSGGGIGSFVDENYICKSETVTETFNRLCCFSVYSHIGSIKNGYITYQGGHRAGVAGTAVCDTSGNVVSVQDIASVNIRISRSVKGAADLIVKELFCDVFPSIIIAGPPSAGKTTVLRDLVRQLSDRLYRVSLIDERQEIACVNGMLTQHDVGINTDIYSCYPKDKGIMNAIKTMAPDIIAIDEIGESDEIAAVKQGLNSGVNFIVTVHASDYQDLICRQQIQSLLANCSFDYIVLLSDAKNPGQIEGIYDAKEIHDEIFRSSFIMDNIYTGRNENIIIA